MKIKFFFAVGTILSATGFAFYGLMLVRGAVFSIERGEHELTGMRKAVAQLGEQSAAMQDHVATLQQQVATLQGQTRKNGLDRLVSPLQQSRPVEREQVAAGAAASLTAIAKSPTRTPSEEGLRKALLESKHRRYDVFLNDRNLAPEQGERILMLLIEQDNIRADLQNAIREQGIAGDSAAIERLRTQFYEPVTRELREILGPEGYAAFGTYEKSSFFRNAYVAPLIPKFQAAQAPLSEAQIANLVSIVMVNHQLERRAPTDISTQPQVDWNSILSKASQILTPTQMQVLQATLTVRSQSNPQK